ncbi:hypothetical protein BT69DRAFT_1216516, partial [Atractiella rhizophila]
SIEGPYAFVYFQSYNKRILYGRDPLGRRSLLMHRPTAVNPYLLFSSTATRKEYALGDWEEVPADCVHCYNLLDLKGKSWLVRRTQDILIYPFDRMSTLLPSNPNILLPFLDASTVTITPELQQALTGFLGVLEESTRKRTTDVPRLNGPKPPEPRIAVLFSGGIDCTTLALLVDKFLPAEEGVDLLNVAFENPRALAAKANAQERARRGQGSAALVPYDVPDRLNARSSLDELRRLRPRRQWRLVEIDVPYEESLTEKEKVKELMWPSKSVMDLSIAMALYFAARGKGTIYDESTDVSTPYTSEARVLISGLGADELLGGYSRHRRAFSPSDLSHLTLGGDWGSLINEMQLDLDRISVRNLGRDDRVISCHGKEVRYPFLDGSVVEYLNALPIWLKCDLRFEEGLGDKLLLRCLASQLGLVETSRARKRAIQFGSRSARMEVEEGKEKPRGDMDAS